MNPEQILLILVGIVFFDFLVQQILDYKNFKSIGNKLPHNVADIYDSEEYRKSQDYQKENARFGFLSTSISTFLYLGALYFGLLGLADQWVSGLIENTVWKDLALLGLLYVGSDILSIPFSYYKTFVIEEKYGFNKSSIGTFILDKVKGYALAAVVGGGLIWLLLFLVDTLGEGFWLYFWGVASLFIVLTNMFYTSLIVPLFNKLKPLEDGELRSAIEEYSKKIEFPLTNIYVVDGSKRSAKANAYFSGIGPNKKIVLFDTLIKNHTTEELVAVLAHEVGHFKRKHILQTLFLSLIQIGVTLFLLSKVILSDSISLSLGADDQSFALNLIAFGLLFSPLSTMVGLLMHMVSRKNEYEADQYAAETSSSKDLQNALRQLSKDNLSNLTPHPAYVFFHHSHPPVSLRLQALEKFKT